MKTIKSRIKKIIGFRRKRLDTYLTPPGNLPETTSGDTPPKTGEHKKYSLQPLGGSTSPVISNSYF